MEWEHLRHVIISLAGASLEIVIGSSKHTAVTAVNEAIYDEIAWIPDKRQKKSYEF